MPFEKTLLIFPFFLFKIYFVIPNIPGKSREIIPCAPCCLSLNFDGILGNSLHHFTVHMAFFFFLSVGVFLVPARERLNSIFKMKTKKLMQGLGRKEYVFEYFQLILNLPSFN